MRNMRDPMKRFNNYLGGYPYKPVRPAALIDQVSGKGEKRNKQVCLQEMSLMLVCLKKYDFDQSRCSKEVEGFMACNKMHKEQAAAPVRPDIATERLPTDLVHSQLRKYPQYKNENN